MLQAHLSELLPDILIIAEEFGDWDDSRRRIDLLALDREANIVVIELKRGDTGIHMELQAVRYAAMVSKITFDQAVETYARYKGTDIDDGDARAQILEFLDWADPSEEDFGRDVKIVLFSEDYSRELTSSILWLNEKGVEITCFRMSAYKLAERLLLDFQQIIPLKEAEEYQIKVRHKQQVEQSERRTRVAWNGEFYANFGSSKHRSWEDARTYGFISAGGRAWFTRTLRVLVPGSRVWVNRPGAGYIGVGEVISHAVVDKEFLVQTEAGPKPYLEISKVGAALREQSLDPDKAEWFVPIRWIKTVHESNAVREIGLFGNQNSAAKPKSAGWADTVARLKTAFDVED